MQMLCRSLDDNDRVFVKEKKKARRGMLVVVWSFLLFTIVV